MIKQSQLQCEYYVKSYPLLLKERIVEPFRKLLNKRFGRYNLEPGQKFYNNSVLSNNNFEIAKNSFILYLNNKFRKYRKIHSPPYQSSK